MRRAPVALCSLIAAACGGSTSPTPAQTSTPPGDWTCVAHARATARLAVVEPARRFVVSLRDADTAAPLAGLSLALCARSDEDCAAPASQASTDEGGEAVLGDGSRPPSSFDGFVRVSRPGTATHFVFLRGRAAACASCPLVVPVYTAADTQTTERMTGLPLDARDGMVRADLEDCAGAPAQDVSLSIGSFGCSGLRPPEGFVRSRSPFFGDGGCAAPVLAYASGGHGNVTRTALATDATGVALAFGVPPGPLGVVELLDGSTVAGALGFVRAGAVSEFALHP